MRKRLEARHSWENVVRQDHVQARLFNKAKRRLRALGSGDPVAEGFENAPDVRELDGVVFYDQDMSQVFPM